MPVLTELDAAIFYVEKWEPFLQELRKHYNETKRRTAEHYDLAQRMPSQDEIDRLTYRCTELTTEFYGKPDLSVLYRAFMKMCHAAQISFYKPMKYETSNDGWLRFIDVDHKNALTQEYFATVIDLYRKSGGRLVRGRSAIDNSYPQNVVLEHEGRRWLARQGMLRVLTKWFKKYRDAGSIPQEVREKLWSFIKDQIPEREYPSSTKELLNHQEQRPGAYYLGTKKSHIQSLLAESEQGNIRLLPRTTVNSLNHRRVINMEFKRLVPLRTVNDGVVVTIREAGTRELVACRMNEGSYLGSTHGMSLPYGKYANIGGNLEITNDPVAFEMNNRFPDFEWMAFEAEMLNTPDAEFVLPETKSIVAGRNSCTGSSIKQTAHSQIAQGQLRDFPLFSAKGNPVIAKEYDCVYDVVQVGSKPDACFLSISAVSLRNKKMLELVNTLIIKMQLRFGKVIDFQMQIIPDRKSKRFCFILIPFTMLEDVGNGVFKNPQTNTTNDAEKVAEHLHLGNCTGTWGSTAAQRLLWKSEGETALRRLYDFVALDHVKGFMQSYLQSRINPGVNSPDNSECRLVV